MYPLMVYHLSRFSSYYKKILSLRALEKHRGRIKPPATSSQGRGDYLTSSNRNETGTEKGRGAPSPSLDSLVIDIKRAVPLEGRLHPGLDRLVEYDKANGSEFKHTLQVYLENNCNAQKCGRLLYLHRNSLVYRIRRIQEIGGFDLSNPEECAFLRLSLLLS